ncbi:MAG: hypothetical protein WC796_05655 [Candidatus Pacearchaeota archaeon]|jgi:hypothetical protein
MDYETFRDYFERALGKRVETGEEELEDEGENFLDKEDARRFFECAKRTGLLGHLTEEHFEVLAGIARVNYHNGCMSAAESAVDAFEKKGRR